MAQAGFWLPDRSSQGKLHPLSFNTNNSKSQMGKWHISCLTVSRAVLPSSLSMWHYRGCCSPELTER